MTFSVIHTEWSDGWGGQEHRIVSEMAGMQARGHRVLLAARVGAAIIEHARTQGIEVRTLPFAHKMDLRTILTLRRWVRDEGFQIIHTHSGIDSWNGALAAKSSGAKLIRTRHLNIPLHRNWLSFVHYMYEALISCGELMRRQLIEVSGFPAGQVFNIPTGIDFDRFQPQRSRAAVRAELGLTDQHYAIVMVGVLRGVKRHVIGIRAFAKLQASLPHARLLLVGDGPLEANCKALVTELGLSSAVTFLGYRSDVADLMIAADAALLTSSSEGVPQAVTQGLGLALPTVATEVGGVPELIIHEQTGLLVPAEDIDAVAAALLRLAHDPALATQLGLAGQLHVQRNFSIESMLDRTETLYGQVLGMQA